MQTCIWYYSYWKSCPLSMFMDGKEQTGVHRYILLQVYYLPSHRIKDKYLWLPKSIQFLGLGLDEVCLVIRDIHISDCWKKISSSKARLSLADYLLLLTINFLFCFFHFMTNEESIPLHCAQKYRQVSRKTIHIKSNISYSGQCSFSNLIFHFILIKGTSCRIYPKP